MLHAKNQTKTKTPQNQPTNKQMKTTTKGMCTIKYWFVNIHVSQTWIGKLHFVLSPENKREHGD